MERAVIKSRRVFFWSNHPAKALPSSDSCSLYPRTKSISTAVSRRRAGRIWKEHGALEYSEGIGDDLDVKEQVPFPHLASLA